jgi:hypothetical protein
MRGSPRREIRPRGGNGAQPETLGAALKKGGRRPAQAKGGSGHTDEPHRRMVRGGDGQEVRDETRSAGTG